jgi:phage head maturation protease
VDEAIQSIKYRLVAAVSIGFSSVEGQIERLKGGGLRFLEWNWHELSLVTIPANADATIQSVKQFDTEQRAATGHTLKGGIPLSPRQGKEPKALPPGSVSLTPRNKK